MAGMKGTLEADFSPFNTEVEKATAKLRVMEAEAARVGPVVDQIGGKAPSTFVALIASADKAGTSMKGFGTETGQAVGPVNDLKGALGQVDGVLASVGVNIGPQVRALGELSDASKKTFTQLGGLATAGLVVGTAMAAWDFGRAIAGWLGLDEKIGSATAKLLGWGDLQGETAGAKQDVMNRAIERGAAVTVSYTEAIQFNNEWQKKLTESQKPAVVDVKALAAETKALADETKRLAAEQAAAAAAAEKWAGQMRVLDAATAGWQVVYDTLSGDVAESIKYYLAAGVSQETLARYFGVTKEQVNAVSQSLREQKGTYKGVADAARAFGDTAEDAQRRATVETKKHTEELAKQKLAIEAAEEAEKRRRAGGTVDFATAAGQAIPATTLQAWLKVGYSLQAAMAMIAQEEAAREAGRLALLQKSGGLPGFAGGVSNYGGGWAMVGERGPEPMYVPQGASIFPSGSGGGAGGAMTVIVNVSGVWDARSKRELTTAVSEGIVEKMRASGWRPPLAVRR